MRFEFATVGKIVFGAGTIKEIGSLASGIGTHALVVSSQGGADPSPLNQFLSGKYLQHSSYTFSGEPSIGVVVDGVNLAKQKGCDFLIGFGGGSAMDMAKAVAVMLTNQGDLLDYLEVIGRGKTLERPAAPVIAVPTTAGTGAEVTRNAVILAPEQHFKASLRSPSMLPRVALVDPELTYSLPPALTATTGMDALTQVIEPYLSSRANPLVDALCKEGIQRAACSIRRAFDNGQDTKARMDMSLVSLFGGLALANAGLGAVHGFASPLGGVLQAPHGAICARLLPVVFSLNARALHRHQPESPIFPRFTEVAQWLTGSSLALVSDGVRWLEELCQDLHIPGLAAYGLQLRDLDDLVVKAASASSMKANPIELTCEELKEILEKAL
jgi:alcohol dehydrogenase class IV